MEDFVQYGDWSRAGEETTDDLFACATRARRSGTRPSRNSNSIPDSPILPPPPVTMTRPSATGPYPSQLKWDEGGDGGSTGGVNVSFGALEDEGGTPSGD